MKEATKKRLSRIGVGVVIVLAVLAVIVALQPDHTHVERSAVVKASPEAVHAYVNDLGNWNSFSPWADLDPNAAIEYEGPRTGKGATFRWDGNNEVGAGSMTIAESVPGEKVRMDLEFTRPMPGKSTAAFTLAPVEGGTNVTWSTDWDNNFISKAMGLIMDCDAMMGGYFEEGLANLKTQVER
ncbi:MAG: SRPBCC family protein [Alphaproteobacteria bacterium]